MTDLLGQSSASVLRISDEKTMQLLDLYHREQCLWNTKLEDYKNREKRAAAALKIATILDLPNFSAKHVIMKFKNLRNSYSQEMKKVAASIAKGDEEVYRPKVFWFPKMDSFIRPFVQVKGDKNRSVPVFRQDDTDEWADQGNEQEPEISLVENSASDEDCSNSSVKRNTPECPEVPLHDLGVPLHDLGVGLKTLKFQHTDHKTTNQMLRDIQSYLHVLLSKNDDSYDTFGRYVASMLRNLPPTQAMALQPRIVEMITRVGVTDAGDSSGSVTSKRRISEDSTLKAKITRKEEDIKHSD